LLIFDIPAAIVFQEVYAMNVSLTPKLEEMVRKKVESGLYNSSSEVIREALRLLQEQDKARESRLDELRAEIRKGIESGPTIPADIVFRELREKASELERTNK
jgi:antitoxin ParD1/3/4